MLAGQPGTKPEREQPRCLTPEIHRLYQAHHQFSPATWVALQTAFRGEQRGPHVTPVPTVGSMRSSHYPLRVHYRLETQLELAEKVLGWAEAAWAIELDSLGFALPLPDGSRGGDDDLDLYLASDDTTSGGAYTMPTYTDSTPDDERRSCASYIVLYEGLDEAVFPVYVAHELNHVSQAATDFEEFLWAWEASATFVEDVVFNEVNDYYRFIPYFQANPAQPLIYATSSQPGLLAPYGAAIFMHFLNETLFAFEPARLAELWERSSQASTTNEPDLLDAIDALARERGWQGLDETYARFALWRYFVGSRDDGMHFEEGASWGSEAGVEVPVSAGQDGVLPVEAEFASIHPLGTGYATWKAPEGEGELRVKLELSSEEAARLGLVISSHLPGGPTQDQIVALGSEKRLEHTLRVAPGAELVIGALHLPGPSFDADQDDTSGSELSLRLSEGSCGCWTVRSAAPSSPQVPAWLILSPLVVLSWTWKRRYRRHQHADETKTSPDTTALPQPTTSHTTSSTYCELPLPE